MVWRVAREVLALVGATLAVLVVITLLLYASSGLEAAELLAVLPEFVFSFTGFALASWGLLVALGATLLRRRGPWWRIGTHALATPIAGIINVVAVVAIGDALDAQGGIVATLGLLGSAVFVPVALLITPVVVLLLERRRSTSHPDPGAPVEGRPAATPDPAGGP